MSDIFREVDEDLRRDRMERFLKRYGVAIGSAVLLAVAVIAAYVAWQAWDRASRQEATAALAAALDRAEQAPAEAVDTLSAFAGGAATDQATLARLNAAALLVRQDKAADAVAVYEAVAGNGDADPILRDYATLMAALHTLESGDPARLAARLEPLTAEASPWRFTARELTGVLAARAGDTERAHTVFRQLADDPQTPAGVRARAADLAALYGKTS